MKKRERRLESLPAIGLSRRHVLAGAGTLLAAVPVVAKAEPLPVLDLGALFKDDDVGRTGFRPEVVALAGRQVVAQGYEIFHRRPDPPRFLCLANGPGSTCPHCAGMLVMPRDMIVYYPFGSTAGTADPARPGTVAGVLELGAERDPQSGFVSTIRLRQTQPLLG